MVGQEFGEENGALCREIYGFYLERAEQEIIVYFSHFKKIALAAILLSPAPLCTSPAHHSLCCQVCKQSPLELCKVKQLDCPPTSHEPSASENPDAK